MSSSGNQDRIEAAQVSAPASGANTPAESNRDVGPRFGRLHSVWYDLLFSDKSASAVTTLYSYGYFISILMTLWGWYDFTEFARVSTIATKFVIQLIGLSVSLFGIYACYSNQPQKLSIFFTYQLTHAILTFFGLYYLLRTSRAELFQEYVTEPFYNIKLVDYPFGKQLKVLDMSAEPAYEISLLYFRAIYMLIVTSLFYLYTLFAVGRRLWNQPLSLPSVTRTSSQEMQSLRQDDEQNVDMEAAPQPPQLTTSFKVQGNFGRKIGLLFGL